MTSQPKARRGKDTGDMHKKATAKPARTSTRRRVGAWLADNTLPLLIIADTAGDSYHNLLTLARHNGQVGIGAFLSAGIFDAMAIYFQREMQKDRRNKRIRKHNRVPSFNAFAQAFCIGFTVAANAMTVMLGFWPVTFAIAAPVGLMVMVFRRDINAAQTDGNREHAETGTAVPSPRTVAGNRAGTAPGNRSAAGTAPVPGTAASPAGTAEDASAPEPAMTAGELRKEWTPGIFPGVEIPAIAGSAESLRRQQVDAVTKIVALYPGLNGGRSLSAEALRIHAGRQKKWAVEILRDIRNTQPTNPAADDTRKAIGS